MFYDSKTQIMQFSGQQNGFHKKWLAQFLYQIKAKLKKVLESWN